MWNKVKCKKCIKILPEENMIYGLCPACYHTFYTYCDKCGREEIRSEIIDGLCNNCYEDKVNNCKSNKYDEFYNQEDYKYNFSINDDSEYDIDDLNITQYDDDYIF